MFNSSLWLPIISIISIAIPQPFSLDDFLFEEEVKGHRIQNRRGIPPHTGQIIHDHKTLLPRRQYITQRLFFQIGILIPRDNPAGRKGVLVFQELIILNPLILIHRGMLFWGVLVADGVTDLFGVTASALCVDVDLVEVDGSLYKVLEVGTHFDQKARCYHIPIEDQATNYELIELLHLLQPTRMHLSPLNGVQHRIIQIQYQYPPLSL